jgi:hypothetical protein
MNASSGPGRGPGAARGVEAALDAGGALEGALDGALEGAGDTRDVVFPMHAAHASVIAAEMSVVRFGLRVISDPLPC